MYEKHHPNVYGKFQNFEYNRIWKMNSNEAIEQTRRKLHSPNQSGKKGRRGESFLKEVSGTQQRTTRFLNELYLYYTKKKTFSEFNGGR
jgi:hypothetical protein